MTTAILPGVGSPIGAQTSCQWAGQGSFDLSRAKTVTKVIARDAARKL